MDTELVQPMLAQNWKHGLKHGFSIACKYALKRGQVMLCLENVCIKNILFYLDVDFASFKNRFHKVNWSIISIMCISLWLHIFGKVRFKVVGVVGTMVFSRTVQNEPHCAKKYCRRSPQEMLNLYPLQCRKRDHSEMIRNIDHVLIMCPSRELNVWPQWDASTMALRIPNAMEDS